MIIVWGFLTVIMMTAATTAYGMFTSGHLDIAFVALFVAAIDGFIMSGLIKLSQGSYKRISHGHGEQINHGLPIASTETVVYVDGNEETYETF